MTEGTRRHSEDVGSAAFYTVADRRFFPGVVGLLNSLRLVGHEEQLYVLDAGLTREQRAALAPHCTVVPRAPERLSSPLLYKPYPRLLEAEGVVVIVDSDLIVSRSMAEVIDAARAGRICAFADPVRDYWFAEWEEVFALKAPPRRQTYVSSHLVAFSTEHWPGLLERWWDACAHVVDYPSRAEGGAGAAIASDQDALNALLMSEYPSRAVEILPPEERPVANEMRWVRVRDQRRLKCTFAGRQVAILHFDGRPKPWERGARWTVRRDAYVRLLRRLLHDSDVRLRWPEGQWLPPWLQASRWSRLLLRALDVVNTARGATLRTRAPMILAQEVLSPEAYARLKRIARRPT